MNDALGKLLLKAGPPETILQPFASPAGSSARETGTVRSMGASEARSDFGEVLKASQQALQGQLTAAAGWHAIERSAGSGKPPGALQQRLKRIVSNKYFEFAMACLILCNVATIGLQRHWNVFDLGVVLVADLEVLLQNLNLSFMRVLRGVRVVKTVRILRVFSIFRALRVMAASLASCLLSVTWAFILIGVAMYLLAVVLMEGASSYLATQQQSQNPKTVATLTEYFNDLPHAMLSILMTISGGIDWYDLVGPFRSVHPIYAALFTVFIIFVTFGMLNVLVGIFVQRAGEITSHDKELVIQEEMARHTSYLNQLRGLFEELDKNGSSTISYEELEAAIDADARVTTYFKLLDLDVLEAKALFKLLDVDEKGEVGIEEFIMGCMRLKGTARSVDLATMLYENKRAIMRWNAFIASTGKELKAIREALEGDVQGLNFELPA